MPLDLSPQANIPVRRNRYQLSLSKVASIPWGQISAPRIVAITEDGQEVLPRCEHAVLRLIQNVGIQPVKILVGDADTCKPGKYHQILRPGLLAEDGQGGQMDFSMVSQRVTACTEVGMTGSIAIFYALAPENL